MSDGHGAARTLWAELPDGLASGSGQVARRATARGVVFAPGDAFSVGRTAGRYTRFNVARCGPARVFDVLQEAMAA